MPDLILDLVWQDRHRVAETLRLADSGEIVARCVQELDRDLDEAQQENVNRDGIRRGMQEIEAIFRAPGAGGAAGIAGAGRFGDGAGSSLWFYLFAHPPEARGQARAPNAVGAALTQQWNQCADRIQVLVRTGEEDWRRQGSDWLGGLPWNLLVRPMPGLGHLHLRDRMEFLVELPNTRPRQAATDVPAGLYLCAASPTDQTGFHTLWTKSRWDEVWVSLARPYFEPVTDMLKPDKASFLAALQKRDVVYYIGHGTSKGPPPESSPGIYLTDSTDEFLSSAFLSAANLGSTAASAGARVRLLVLNCCQSAEVVRAAHQAAREVAQAEVEFPHVLTVHTQWPVRSAFRMQEGLLRQVLQRPGAGIGSLMPRVRQSILDPHVGIDSRAPHPHLPLLYVPGGEGWRQPVLDLEVVVGRSTSDRVGIPPPGFFGNKGWVVGLTDAQRAIVKDAAQARPGAPGVAALVNQLGRMPRRELALAQFPPFRIDKYPVTNHQWRLFCGSYEDQIGAGWETFAEKGEPDVPVSVPFEVAVKYAELLGKRLPKWWEWEVAAREGKPTIVPWAVAGQESKEDLLTTAWFRPDRPRYNVFDAGAVGLKSVFDYFPAPSPFCSDLIGNAQEFVLLDDGNPGIAGLGFDRLLVANIPSLRYPRPAGRREMLCGFRCVRELKGRPI